MNSPYSPWGNLPPYYGATPPNTVFVPVQLPPGCNPEPRNKKEKKNTIKGLAAQIAALDELRKKLEGDKKDKDKDKDKKNEPDFGKLLQAWGMITLFGPPVGAVYFYMFKHFFM